jgi:DNA-binding transcriptional ArsR family regulator
MEPILTVDPNIAAVASLIGDPTRATILTALLSGGKLAAADLARCAGVTPQTASAHLAQLLAGGLLAVMATGRHRYYQLAGPHVASALEALAPLAPAARINSLRRSYDAHALRFARTCYDHLAGLVGVALTDRLLECGVLVRPDEATHTYRVGDGGIAWLERAGLDVEQTLCGRRAAARACLDWSERREHVAGAFGAAMTAWLFEQHWLVRVAGTRAVRLTDAGRAGLRAEWGLDLAEAARVR